MRKIYILYIAAISILSLVYINNTSALDYSSNVGIGFTFNPTLSISLSSSDLVISNLVPGSTLDSNSINVSVATNAAYGYTLSANVNDENLVHSNNVDTFSSIDTNAGLASLDDSDESNIWGYSYKNNIASTPTWSNYSGLSNSANKVLFNTDSNSSGSIDFKIAAKASDTQPSGAYTGTINFTATTKPMPKTIQDIAYMQTFAELDAVDLASVKSSMILNNAYILKDIRDEKEYYVTRLEDGNVWMTQNLDLDLDSNRTYTHYDTDLGWDNSDKLDMNVTWQPIHSTIDFTGDTVDGWVDSYTEPYSANPGDVYYHTSNSDAGDIKYNSLQECISAGHNGCTHYHAGNYYNFSAAIASNNSESITREAPDSICPAGWRLPKTSSNDFSKLLSNSGIIDESSHYMTDGFINIRKSPLYFVRSGQNNANLINASVEGSYIYGNRNSYIQVPFVLRFGASVIYSSYAGWAYPTNFGRSVRCLAR